MNRLQIAVALFPSVRGDGHDAAEDIEKAFDLAETILLEEASRSYPGAISDVSAARTVLAREEAAEEAAKSESEIPF